jgi:hypothetical protein
MYILSSHVSIDVDPKFDHAKNNFDIIDMLDYDIVDIYSENQRMTVVDKRNMLYDE